MLRGYVRIRAALVSLAPLFSEAPGNPQVERSRPLGREFRREGNLAPKVEIFHSSWFSILNIYFQKHIYTFFESNPFIRSHMKVWLACKLESSNARFHERPGLNGGSTEECLEWRLGYPITHATMVAYPAPGS